MKVKSESEVTQSCLTLSDPMDCSLLGSSVNGIFPDKSTGVGCHCLLHKYIRYFAKRWKNSVLNKKYEVPVLMELMVLCMWQILNQYSHNLKINIGKCDDWIWCIYRSALVGLPHLWWGNCSASEPSWQDKSTKQGEKIAYLLPPSSLPPFNLSSMGSTACLFFMCAQALSSVWLFVTPWTVTQQVSLSMEFFRQECWSGLSFPSPGGLPDSGTEPTAPVSPALAGRFLTSVPPGKPLLPLYVTQNNFKHSSWYKCKM